MDWHKISTVSKPDNLSQVINCICPGLIDTQMVRETVSKEEMKKWIHSIPMNRLGSANEEAELVLFLVSEASTYINGATIDLNGASLLI